jgi:surface carbohydrate biosynthesis protein
MRKIIDKKPTLLLPIENQVRELDPRLLLASIAASRGLPTVIGPIREIDFHISSYPGSLYLSKSMLPGRLELFKIMSRLGIVIFALDEEALVHLPPEIYYSRRLCPEAMACVTHLFAWGQDNADLWRHYSHFPASAEIHLTGNPRNDMLRPEIRSFYEEEVSELRKKFKDFILINTNFNHVNAFYPTMNLFLPKIVQDETLKFGNAAKGMTFDYAQGLWEHKSSLFRDFQNLIPALDRAFPDYTIVVRPHPTENQDVYRGISSQCKRVQVTNEGNVVPWLIAAKALIHNGCTTGVEAYVIGVPSISYRASVNNAYDNGFYRLPNMLSHQCFNFEDLCSTLKKILAKKLEWPELNQSKDLLNYHLTAIDGPLASSRMVDVFEEILKNRHLPSDPSPLEYLKNKYKTFHRGLKKRYKTFHHNSHLKQDFQRHRYPVIPLQELRMRVLRFQKLLSDEKDLKLEKIFNESFRISQN